MDRLNRLWARIRPWLGHWGTYVVLAYVLLAIGIVDVHRINQKTADSERRILFRQCVEIQTLKNELRPPPFDLERKKQILRDLGRDPESEASKRLIDENRRETNEDRRKFAARECE